MPQQFFQIFSFAALIIPKIAPVAIFCVKLLFFCSIDERPVEINQRMRLGDLEVDTIESQKDDKFNIATTIDRRSRRVATSIYEGKNPEKFAAAIANNICNLNVIPLSITADNGVENHQLKTLKKQFPTIENFYSTHSYAG